MKEIIIIDRIEEGIAVCESESDNMQLHIHLSELPIGVLQGDVLIKSENGYIIDKVLTKIKKQQNIKLQNSLWEK